MAAKEKSKKADKEKRSGKKKDCFKGCSTRSSRRGCSGGCCSKSCCSKGRYSRACCPGASLLVALAALIGVGVFVQKLLSK